MRSAVNRLTHARDVPQTTYHGYRGPIFPINLALRLIGWTASPSGGRSSEEASPSARCDSNRTSLTQFPVSISSFLAANPSQSESLLSNSPIPVAPSENGDDDGCCKLAPENRRKMPGKCWPRVDTISRSGSGASGRNVDSYLGKEVDVDIMGASTSSMTLLSEYIVLDPAAPGNFLRAASVPSATAGHVSHRRPVAGLARQSA